MRSKTKSYKSLKNHHRVFFSKIRLTMERTFKDSSTKSSYFSTSPGVRRSRSVRASFRLLKDKIHENFVQPSPFKLNSVHSDNLQSDKNLQKECSDFNENVICNDSGTEFRTEIETNKTRETSERFFQRNPNGDIVHYKQDIEKLMSIIPDSVPRKACQLLQIPTNVLKCEEEIAVAESGNERLSRISYSTNACAGESNMNTYISKGVSLGAMKTATIRRRSSVNRSKDTLDFFHSNLFSINWIFFIC